MALTLILFAVNPFCYPCTVFFRQERMGIGFRPFIVSKFQTMTVSDTRPCAPHAPLEVERITPLGHVMRRLRIGELLSFLSVLTGEKSLSGSRPDAIGYAQSYIGRILYFRFRHTVRPGINVQSEVRGCYSDALATGFAKARYNRYCMEHRSLQMKFYILLRTCRVVLTEIGTK